MTGLHAAVDQRCHCESSVTLCIIVYQFHIRRQENVKWDSWSTFFHQSFIHSVIFTFFIVLVQIVVLCCFIVPHAASYTAVALTSQVIKTGKNEKNINTDAWMTSIAPLIWVSVRVGRNFRFFSTHTVWSIYFISHLPNFVPILVRP